MGWCHRDESGNIDGWAPLGAAGFTEEIAEDDPEVQAFINPPPPAVAKIVISDRQFYQALAVQSQITQQEALDAVKVGTIPVAIGDKLAGFPPDQKFNAEMMLSGATAFERYHPMTLNLQQMMGWTDQATDELWNLAASL